MTHIVAGIDEWWKRGNDPTMVLRLRIQTRHDPLSEADRDGETETECWMMGKGGTKSGGKQVYDVYLLDAFWKVPVQLTTPSSLVHDPSMS